MATRSISRTDLVGLTSLSFIRPQIISFMVSNTKPSTKLYAFFDGKSVDQYITPLGGVLGGDLLTDASGTAGGIFTIPPATFNTGTRNLRFQDMPGFDASAIPGSNVGSAEASFHADGLKKTLQETVTNIEEIEHNNVVNHVNTIVNTNYVTVYKDDPKPPPKCPQPTGFFWSNFGMTGKGSANDGISYFGPGGDGYKGGAGDPLAQTFFTYGVTGGCFITKFDLYFYSKDANIPVSLEIRNVVNGYPGPQIIAPHAKVSLSPSLVTTSADASAATTFTFSRPVYLEEDQEYCFVIKTNTNNYNVWTSVFGDKSIETGKTIFEQPFIGTLFKSENNITWTAEQTEDIKFTMYKAAFDTTNRNITFKANAPPVIVFGSSFSVTNGASLVTAQLPFQHGFITTDKIYLRGLQGSVYRGVSSAIISASAGYSVVVVDDYTFTFDVGTNFTSTGTLYSSGFVNRIDVDAGGSGYTAPSITISDPPSGTTATATAVVVGGVITSVTITNPGTGYVSTPSVTISGAGSGAILTAISEALFETPINRKFQYAGPMVYSEQPGGTRIVNTLKTTSNDTGTYSVSSVASNHSINTVQNMNKHAVLMTSTAETDKISGSASTQMVMRLETDNANVSPVVNLAESAVLRMQNMLVNEYNDTRNTSELAASGGTAQARYISKMISLANVSKGVRVFVNAASISTTSFDVFIRTSLASNGVNHRAGGWTALTCDIARNTSTTMSNFKDYEFYLDDMTQFDIYDLKIVLYSPVKYVFPIIGNYRCIILAT